MANLYWTFYDLRHTRIEPTTETIHKQIIAIPYILTPKLLVLILRRNVLIKVEFVRIFLDAKIKLSIF